MDSGKAQVALLLLLAVFTAPLDGTDCLPGWLKFGRSCYRAVYGAGTTFWEARTACQSLGADLLWLESQEELVWATANDRFGIKSNWEQCGACGTLNSAWIGLLRVGASSPNATHTADEWVWVRDGSPLKLTLTWYFGHPRAKPNDFVSLTEVTAPPRFRTDPQTQRMFSICKLDPEANRGPCPSGEAWLQFDGFCYLLVKGTNGRNLTEAVADCQRRDASAHLLWITSQAELEWVTDYSARKWTLRVDYREQCMDCGSMGGAAWTGLYRDVSDGQFKWLRDNSPLDVNV